MTEPDDPIRRVLHQIDALLHELEIRSSVLAEVRDLLRREAGEQTGGSSPHDYA